MAHTELAHPQLGRAPWAASLIAAGVLVLDQVSKHWALRRLVVSGGHLSLPGPVDLTLTFNRSNAFGLTPVAGDITRWGLVVFNLAIAVALVWAIWARRYSPLAVLAFGFILAGAVGNAWDRLAIGSVIDFLDASEIGFPWIFNLADAAVDVGIGLVLIDSFSKRQAG